MENLILVDIHERVATLTLNRPNEGNSWTDGLETELRQNLIDAEQNSEIRAMVITGAGRSFCVGRSVQSLSGEAQGNKSTKAISHGPQELDKRLSYIMDLKKPVIAAINGGVAGIGFVLSLYCDLRFMSAQANLSTSFARRGLIAEEGSAWILPRLIGRMNALDLLLSARKVSALEAEALGLVRTLPQEGFLAGVQEYASELANFSSPRSMQLIKTQIGSSNEASLLEATQESRRLLDLSLRHKDFAEGVSHFIEKRRPNFDVL